MRDELMFPEQIELIEEPPLTGHDGSEQLFIGKKFGIRAVAYSIDTLLIGVTNFCITFVLMSIIVFIGLAGGRQAVFNSTAIDSFYLIIILILLISLFYFTLFEGLYGASPGKLILGMRVVKEDGAACSTRAALHRGLWRYIDGLFWGLIALINMSKPLEQRLGDKKAHTVVINKDDLLPENARGWSSFILAMLIFVTLQSVVLFISFFTMYSIVWVPVTFIST